MRKPLAALRRREAQGGARRKTQTYGVREPSTGPRRAPLGAPQAAFSLRRQAALSRFRSAPCRTTGAKPGSSSEAVAQRSTVSQLLAGTRIGPGRSPGAARVPTLRDRPAGAAPRPASRRLMMRPSNGRGEANCKPALESGHKFRAMPEVFGRTANLAGMRH
jgi:hypothetical protein